MAGVIRLAAPPDTRRVITCVDAAFAGYTQRIGKPPAPMLAAWPDLIGRGSVYLLEDLGLVAGVLVLEPCPDHLFVETLAVDPKLQRTGVGRRQMAFAETESRRHGLGRIELYTHEVMAEALAFYQALGYHERERRVEDGYARIYLTRPTVPFA